MAPLAYSGDLRSGNGLVRRARSDDCSGWNCLSDAAQFGIILVIVAFVLVTGYLYWRLKVKPHFRGSDGDTRTPINGYWEVTRRDPSTVSITIYRELRPLSDSEAGQTERRAPKPKKRDNGPTQPENDVTNQVAEQLGAASTSDVHLVPPPPPPPPVFWTAPAPSVIPPPPPFGPPTFLQPGPPPSPLHPNPIGFGTAAVPYPPVAPPPYFGHAAPQNLEGHYPMPGVAATSQPACPPPPPATSSAPPRNEHRGRAHTPPVAEPQIKWRRWFSRGVRSPIIGHARTLSDVSSTAGRSRSPSPPPPSVSPPRRDRGRGGDHSRRPSNRQPHSPARDRQTRQRPQPPRQTPHSGARNQRRRNDSSPPSESSFTSSYLNTSLEAVLDAREPPRQSFRNHVRASSDPESRRARGHHRRRPDTGKSRDTRIRPSDTVPLANLLRHHRRRRRRLSPSPDVQFPSPEPHRPRVSFELPGYYSDDGSTSSSSLSSSSRSSGSYQRRVSSRSRQPRRDGHGGSEGRRRGVGQEREQPGLADRITGTFYRMRRALRGED